MVILDPHSPTAVLRNRNFLALWMAQVLSNTALTGSFFIQLVLIEQVTGSSAQLAAVILAFSLPAVLLSAVAGIVVDRVPKKSILVASNALRVLTGAALAFLASYLLSHNLSETIIIIFIYVLVFMASAIGQFFAPAEGATIPLLVSKDHLLSANSLFTLTFTASQILGLVILAPLGIKLVGIAGSLWVVVAMYLGATLLVTLIPRDRPVLNESIVGMSTLRGARSEFREGWQFAISRRALLTALLQLALVSTLTMIMAELAPGFAKRVLGLQAEDATYIFWPAGAGILVASLLIGKYGNRVRRAVLATAGMLVMGVALAGLAWTTSDLRPFDQPLFVGHPESILTTVAMVMFFALFVGVSMAMINIPAQTIVQERSNDAVRGRVLAVQFTLSNALGIPPMLLVGNLADTIGIPRVTLLIGGMVILLAVLNIVIVQAMSRLPSNRHPTRTEDALNTTPPAVITPHLTDP
jgi:MFS family permease